MEMTPMAGGDLPRGAEKARAVERMFDRIAPRYDLVNRIMTFRLDQRWRRATIRAARIAPGDVVIDLACGTGDLTEMAAAAGARVIGVDFAARMLAVARRRGSADLVRADAAALPLADASADAMTSAFALRNFVELPPVMREAARVLRPGGRLALLEVDEPRDPIRRWGHALYFRRLVPLVGGVLSDRAAYRYLPASTAYLPAEPELLALVREAGFATVAKHRLSAGIAQLIVAER